MIITPLGGPLTGRPPRIEPDTPEPIHVGHPWAATRAWPPWRDRPRAPGAPSRAILERANAIHDILDNLKRETHAMDNATKAAVLALRV